MDKRTPDKATHGGVSGTTDTWFHSARDAADATGFNERTIRRAIKSGTLPAIKHGGVFQITEPDLLQYTKRTPGSIAPLVKIGDPPRSAPPGNGNLPVSLTPLIGRECEIAAATNLLRQPERLLRARLLTLTGSGGVGKTRLAVRIAEVIATDYPDGVWFVSLAPITDPARVSRTVARVLGVRETRTGDLAGLIGNWLAHRRALLILDNFEQVIDAAPLVTNLLAHCADLSIIVTSRMRLRVSGEHEQVVPTLAHAEPMNESLRAAPTEAIQLFVARAQAVREDFDLTDDNARLVSAICSRLDGLPLAIELAAALVKVLPLESLLNRLEHRLPLLTAGGRDMPARQQTIRATIAWSHDLLTIDEQALFRKMAVFVGGCTLEAAEAICAEPVDHKTGDQSTSVLDGITALVEKSLLTLESEAGSACALEARYLMLETVREFAQEKLDESDEAVTVRERHANYFADSAEAIAPLLQWRPDIGTSVATLDAELENLSAALIWSYEHASQTVFLRLAAALQSFWSVRGQLPTGREWLVRAISKSETAAPHLRADVLRAAGWHARYQGEYDRAEMLVTEALHLSRMHSNPPVVAHALTALGFIAEDRGDYAGARQLHEEALAIGKRENSSVWIAWSTRDIGIQAYRSGDLITAERRWVEALELFQQQGHYYGAADVMSNLALVVLSRGERARAAEMWQARLAMTWDEYGLRPCLDGVASIALACHDLETAARLFGAADAHRERLGGGLSSAQNDAHLRDMETVRAGLGLERFSLVWNEGQRMSAAVARADAVRVASVIQATEADDPIGAAEQAGLTTREAEVLRLLAAGNSNSEIAIHLYISVPTVKRHLTNIYGKFAVTSRTAAVEFAWSNRLI